MRLESQRFVASFAVVALLASVLAFAPPAAWSSERASEPMQTLSGDVTRVIDASTLEIGGDRGRLWGLYTAGLGTARGADASLFVHKLTLGQVVSCKEMSEGAMRGGKTVLARCWLGGTDLTEAIIAAGHGRECTRDSRGVYRRVEAPFVLIRLPLPTDCGGT